ncbi:acyl CoA:acetate/3-ketoacid CoA transferase [Ruminococcus sp. CLA-AA-H200]|uniref:Acyl CoA:acetate/3-ketoacid CoA transferase n=1 Tax=Ruminococcus turbiniformis TaxID=2881258 RepID=A0ABS8FZA7_9FIRM|nr:CoA-transferase [Ruminococcus turbiniformis]MCC2255393.1 acyl CoA:acetate/3-ketoacid CoA transferase [Ruminococcus turbiniformis]
MSSKICTAAEAAALVKDGAFLVCAGNMNNCLAEEICAAIEQRFLDEGHPSDMTIMSGSGIGDMGPVGGVFRGFEHFAHDGMIRRVIVGHNGSNHTIMQMQQDLKVESYNFPQGVIEHMFKARARGMDVELTKVGLGTFVDPRQEGGKTNSVTTKDLVEVVNVMGQEYLAYKTPKIDVALIRGTTADEEGNLTCEDEAVLTNIQAIAMAAKASGGIVLCQVKNVVKKGALPAKEVIIPGVFIDKLIVCTDLEKNHRMTMGEYYNPAYTGKYKYPVSAAAALPLGVKKTIARRAAQELKFHVPVNTGLGYPEGIASVANEEGIADELVLTVETGAFGGVPAARTSFGATTNALAFVDSPTIFDLYDGGFLYATFVGLAECDPAGSVNVSRFMDKSGRERRPGAGGFINLTQGAKNVIFCGTMTAGGYKAEIRDGKLVILQEGAEKKFLNSINQVTFSGPHAMEIGQNVLYITDRCVFRLTKEGLVLTEVAPGIDIETQILPFMEFRPIIADDVKEMDPKLFMEGLIGLREDIESRDR